MSASPSWPAATAASTPPSSPPSSTTTPGTPLSPRPGSTDQAPRSSSSPTPSSCPVGPKAPGPSSAESRSTPAPNAPCWSRRPTATGVTTPTRPAPPSISTRPCALMPVSRTTSAGSRHPGSNGSRSPTWPPTRHGCRPSPTPPTSSAGSSSSASPDPSPPPNPRHSGGGSGTPRPHCAQEPHRRHPPPRPLARHRNHPPRLQTDQRHHLTARRAPRAGPTAGFDAPHLTPSSPTPSPNTRLAGRPGEPFREHERRLPHRWRRSPTTPTSPTQRGARQHPPSPASGLGVSLAVPPHHTTSAACAPGPNS
jgi:hypothetical protein